MQITESELTKLGLKETKSEHCYCDDFSKLFSLSGKISSWGGNEWFIHMKVAYKMEPNPNARKSGEHNYMQVIDDSCKDPVKWFLAYAYDRGSWHPEQHNDNLTHHEIKELKTITDVTTAVNFLMKK